MGRQRSFNRRVVKRAAQGAAVAAARCGMCGAVAVLHAGSAMCRPCCEVDDQDRALTESGYRHHVTQMDLRCYHDGN